MRAKTLCLIALFAGLSAAGAFIRLEMPYISFTFQTLFAVLAGMILGARRGVMSQIVYILIGLIGLPVFAKGGGLAYIAQPSFGYILGFPLCAAVSGTIMRKKTSVPARAVLRSLAASFAGFFSVYLIGLPYMYFCFILIGNAQTAGTVLLWGFSMVAAKDALLAVAVGAIAYKTVPAIRKYV